MSHWNEGSPFAKLVVIILTTLCVGFTALFTYEMIDFIGTLTHWWHGNAFNEWAVHGLEVGAFALFDAIKTLLTILFLCSAGALMWLGFSKSMAEFIVMSVVFIFYAIVLYYSGRWVWREEIKSWRSRINRK